MGLSDRVSRLENARPSIEFVQSSFTHLRQQEAQIFSLLQVWFLNAPKVRTSESVAKNVEAGIGFWTEDGTRKLFDVLGQWLEASAPMHEAFKDGLGARRLKEDIGSVTPSKLRVAFKWPMDKHAYGYAFENFLADHMYDGEETPRMFYQKENIK
jgi:hypothetical protein